VIPAVIYAAKSTIDAEVDPDEAGRPPSLNETWSSDC
jgi:hypothetical protein